MPSRCRAQGMQWNVGPPMQGAATPLEISIFSLVSNYFLISSVYQFFFFFFFLVCRIYLKFPMCLWNLTRGLSAILAINFFTLRPFRSAGRELLHLYILHNRGFSNTWNTNGFWVVRARVYVWAIQRSSSFFFYYFSGKSSRARPAHHQRCARQT